MNENDYLTIEEVTDILRLKKATVWGMCRNGRLPAFKQPGGKIWLIDRRAFEKQQRENRRIYGN